MLLLLCFPLSNLTLLLLLLLLPLLLSLPSSFPLSPPPQKYDDFMESVASGLQRRLLSSTLPSGSSSHTSAAANLSLQEQALQALTEEESLIRADRDRLAALAPVDYRERRQQAKARSESNRIEEQIRQERVEKEREVRALGEAMERAKEDAGTGVAYGIMEQSTFFETGPEIVDKSKEVKEVAADIVKAFTAVEYEDGTGHKSNPFRMEITRENCGSFGAPDYFTKVALGMSLPVIERKLEGSK